MVEQNPVPIYFKKGEAIHNGILGLSLDQLRSKSRDGQAESPSVFYGNVRDFGKLESDNFTFETSLKNDLSEGASVCQRTEIQLLCEGSMLSIPLSAKGCISDINLFCLGQYRSGKENDLSGFGVNYDDFVRLRVNVANGKASYFVNEKLVYQLDGITLRSKVVGIIYKFQGLGSVDWVKLKNGAGEVVYEDEFSVR